MDLYASVTVGNTIENWNVTKKGTWGMNELQKILLVITQDTAYVS